MFWIGERTSDTLVSSRLVLSESSDFRGIISGRSSEDIALVFKVLVAGFSIGISLILAEVIVVQRDRKILTTSED